MPLSLRILSRRDVSCETPSQDGVDDPQEAREGRRLVAPSVQQPALEVGALEVRELRGELRLAELARPAQLQRDVDRLVSGGINGA